MPTLKVGAYTFMFAVPDSDHFFAIDFLPGALHPSTRCMSCLRYNQWPAVI